MSSNNKQSPPHNLSPLAIIEGLLFVQGHKGVSLQELKQCLKQSFAQIKHWLKQLNDHYQTNNSPFILTQHNDLYCLRTKTSFYPYFLLLQERQQSPRLTSASLETLAIIAYKGPISGWEIENIRKLSCRTVLHNLLARNLIRSFPDHKNGYFLYEVTDHFLKIFNLSSLEELPEFDLSNLNVDATEQFDLFNDQDHDAKLEYQLGDDEREK